MVLLDENWNYHVDIFDSEEQDLVEFEKKIKCMSNHVLDLLEYSHFNKLATGTDSAPSTQADLRGLIEKNKQLREEIDEKVDELKQHQTKYENFKQDRKLLTQEIKDTYEAFLMGKKYYKKYLKLYLAIDSVEDDKQKIFVQFFTESRKPSEMYSIVLLRDMKTSEYELIEMTPKLTSYKEIQKKLQETNDAPGALCCIRQLFLKVKQNKK